MANPDTSWATGTQKTSRTLSIRKNSIKNLPAEYNIKQLKNTVPSAIFGIFRIPKSKIKKTKIFHIDSYKNVGWKYSK